MKDASGQTLAEGDAVMHARSGRYGGIEKRPWYVHSFTEKRVRLVRTVGDEAPSGYNTVPPENLIKVPHDRH